MANNTNPKNGAASGIAPLAAGTLQIASITSNVENNIVFIGKDVTLTVTFNEAAPSETEPEVALSNYSSFDVKTPWALNSDRTSGTIVLTAKAPGVNNITAILTDGNAMNISLQTKYIAVVKTIVPDKTELKVGEKVTLNITFQGPASVGFVKYKLTGTGASTLEEVTAESQMPSNTDTFKGLVVLEAKAVGNHTINFTLTSPSEEVEYPITIKVLDNTPVPPTPTSGISIKNITVTPTEVERTQSVTVKVEFNKAATDGDFKVTSIGLEEVSPMTLAGDKLSASGTFKATMLGEVSVGAYILPNLTSPVKATLSVKPSSTPEVITFSSLPTGGVDTPLTQEESFKIFRYLFYPDVTRS